MRASDHVRTHTRVIQFAVVPITSSIARRRVLTMLNRVHLGRKRRDSRQLRARAWHSPCMYRDAMAMLRRWMLANWRHIACWRNAVADCGAVRTVRAGVHCVGLVCVRMRLRLRAVRLTFQRQRSRRRRLQMHVLRLYMLRRYKRPCFLVLLRPVRNARLRKRNNMVRRRGMCLRLR